MSEWVLGIDPSTITGWVALHKGGHCEWGEAQFKKQNGIQRVDSFLGWANDIMEIYRPRAVFIEGYGYANKYSLATLVEVGTAIRLALHAHGCEYVEIAPSALKKFATGKGNSKKEQIMLAVFKKWGFDPETNNIADAYVLAKMAEAETWK
jgi:crossover junction endodeoxyribonuclease RuvC